jgi:starch synthase (maltosyl-transferring)
LNQSRVIISSVSPILTGENHQLKRIIDDHIHVSVTAFADGHDFVQVAVVYKHQNDRTWKEVRLQPGEQQDDWVGQFQVSKIGTFKYNIEGWVDWPLNWLYGTRKKIEAKQNVKSEVLEG